MQLTVNGESLETKGTPLEVGANIENVSLKTMDGQEVQLQELVADKVTILSVVPNILTRTCELQTKHFAKETQDKGYQFFTVSRNTPEEFDEWAYENDVKVQTLSDYQGDFGKAFGIEIDLGGNDLLTRSVYVIDQKGKIAYVDYVKEVTEEPNYDAALAKAEELSK